MKQEPYLSVVATARNDNHGGSLLRRMQVFVDAWISQAKRHDLSSELILVEWNPPCDKDSLVRALQWPSDTGPCQVRVINVPAEIHNRYRHAAALPLYQMIAKNVGIRRARGEFVLVTNIDIVFPDELVQFLASRSLESGRMYRVDRHDVMSDVPVEGTIEEQLDYCRKHIIRICAREGTFSITPEGFRQNQPEDITGPESGVYFGNGWFPVERYDPAEPFRWIENDADLFLQALDQHATLVLETEPGPGIGQQTPIIEAIDGTGTKVAEWVAAGRTSMTLGISPSQGGGPQRIRLRVPNGGRPSVHDPRILNFRVFRCDWKPYAVPPPVPRPSKVDWYETMRPQQQEIDEMGNSVFLHLNGCGDFTLMAREHWMDLRGYPELDQFSMHLDSILCASAHHGGAREEFLPPPMCIYHIEHSPGSGWTPEGQAKLDARIAEKRISRVSYEEVVKLIALMRRLHAPVIFNGGEWGLAEIEFSETVLPREQATASGL